MDGKRKTLAKDLKWLKYHKILASECTAQGAVNFAGRIFGKNANLAITSYIDTTTDFPCILEVWFEDSAGDEIYLKFIGDAWIDVMREIDPRIKDITPADTDDIPF